MSDAGPPAGTPKEGAPDFEIDGSGPPHTRAHAAHLGVAFVSGLAVMTIEFAAVRFMAPSFGQSNYIWANVIGVILLALSLGYWLGGRLADASRSGRPLYVAYALAALYVTAIAFVGEALCRWLLPADVMSVHLLPLAFTGSLVATVILFAPPTLVLGMTSPFLIRLDDRPGAAGRVAGRIFAVGTLGSLVGCYLGPLWMLQALGSRATLLASAAALGALSVVGLLWGGASRKAVAAAAVVGGTALGLLGVSEAAEWPFHARPGEILRVESTYQLIRVAEEETEIPVPSAVPLFVDVENVRTRFLRHDEDAENYQSVWFTDPEVRQRRLTGGRYYEHVALGSWFSSLQPADERLRVLIIGYAGGTVHQVLEATKPPELTLEVLGIELDPEVVEVARSHLGLAELEVGGGLRIVAGEDARTVLNGLAPDDAFDLIVVDAYARTTYIPFQLATIELFELLDRHRRPGGWIALNLLGSRGLSSELVRAVAATTTKAIGPTWGVPNPMFPGSTLLWVGGDTAPRLRTDGPGHTMLLDVAFALERLGALVVPDEDAPVFTDDRSAIDRLSDREMYGP